MRLYGYPPSEVRAKRAHSLPETPSSNIKEGNIDETQA
jgi:hypothetical protein